MRSSELAALADVTVRTLRHYHQIGLLPEPERGTNGYRDYSVHDLIAVLRIRRLAALGIPLERIGAVSAAAPADADATLAALDEELEAQIEQLEARRRLIAALRSEGAPLDLPPEFARVVAALSADRPPEATAMDRELFLLLSHVSGREDAPRMLALLEQVTALEGAAEARAAQQQFDTLRSHATEDERTALVDLLVAQYASLARAARELGAATIAPTAVQLLDDYMTDRLNPAQADVLRRIEARLDTSVEVEHPAG